MGTDGPKDATNGHPQWGILSGGEGPECCSSMKGEEEEEEQEEEEEEKKEVSEKKGEGAHTSSGKAKAEIPEPPHLKKQRPAPSSQASGRCPLPQGHKPRTSLQNGLNPPPSGGGGCHQVTSYSRTPNPQKLCTKMGLSPRLLGWTAWLGQGKA